MAVFILAFGLFCTTAQAANNNIKVTVDGKQIAFTDAKPFIDKNNRTQVPMRALGEALGCNVDYQNGEVIVQKKTKSGLNVEAHYEKNNDTTIWFSVFVNGHDWIGDLSDSGFIMKNNRTYLPARYVAEDMGYTVDWNPATNTVIVKTNPNDLLFNAIATSVSASDLYGTWKVNSTYNGKVIGYVTFDNNIFSFTDGSNTVSRPMKVVGSNKNLFAFKSDAYIGAYANELNFKSDLDLDYTVILVDKNTALMAYLNWEWMGFDKLTRVQD